MSDEMTLWVLYKRGHAASAVTRIVPGIGRELRFLWDGDLRQSRVYRGAVEMAAAASQKREELVENGWAELPKLARGN